MQVRGAINRVWRQLAEPRAALLALVLLVAIQLLTLALPQIPVSPSDTIAYSRWLAEIQPRLGEQTRLLASLGLLTVRTSLIMRLALAYLALLVAVNADSLRNSRASTERGTAGHLDRWMVCAGGLLIIGGWAAQMLWGWHEPEIITWPGEAISIPERSFRVAQPRGPLGFWSGGYGHYVMARGQRTGLEVRATDGNAPLLLQPSVNEAPQEVLRLALTTRDPEAFFAIQEAELIFRLNQIADVVQVQTYRSASGDLLVEDTLERNEMQTVLQINGVEVSIAQTPLPRYQVAYNPGAFFEGLGLVALAAGTIIQHRFRPSNDEESGGELASEESAEKE